MAVVIPYVKNPTWADGSGGGTSIDAADLNKQEDGIHDAHYQPAVRVTHNANQSITTATPTVLAFNTERFDTAGNAASTMHDNVTNNSRLTCRYAGKYLVTAQFLWASNATGLRQVRIRKNAAASDEANVLSPALSGAQTGMSVTVLVDMAVNDYVEVLVQQTSGGALNVETQTGYSPDFMMVRVG